MIETERLLLRGWTDADRAESDVGIGMQRAADNHIDRSTVIPDSRCHHIHRVARS
ncbi:hypothetical protein SAMN03159338_1653 [Sphingomonas sp. NFR04]|uniref:hypothetical protein n=1 Tax=Sphingomonas sp. NFR04 TaxID=1566283 RepID=UPI0008F06C6C|nr:hypothetical protein [Sphingomonas sp. NFR04]SFJ52318.1 hypothetical protein SAMN03159338_1653 [Sphingomonas sp. NFR04]